MTRADAVRTLMHALYPPVYGQAVATLFAGRGTRIAADRMFEHGRMRSTVRPCNSARRSAPIAHVAPPSAEDICRILRGQDSVNQVVVWLAPHLMAAFQLPAVACPGRDALIKP